MTRGETYQEFVNKFKHKKTTDDCYTPKEVYEAVKTWAVEQYKLENYNIVRPFYPGGDYESYKYTDNDVIIDNPPFSILAKIVRFYLERNIKFFLFCPTITAMHYIKDKEVTVILTGLHDICYENGVKVVTSFITNLDKSTAIRLNNELWARIEPEPKKKMLKHEYPPNVLNAFNLSVLLRGDKERTTDISISRDEVMPIIKLDEQKGTKIYGTGVLVSDNVVNKLDPLKENHAKNNSKVVWQFSDREKDIIKQLNQSN